LSRARHLRIEFPGKNGLKAVTPAVAEMTPLEVPSRQIPSKSRASPFHRKKAPRRALEPAEACCGKTYL